MLHPLESWLKLRNSKKVSISEIANKSGISRKNISRFENGHQDINLTNFQKLLATLNCSIIIIDHEPEATNMDDTTK